MTIKPFWEPTQTLAAMAHGTSATIAPRTNWGSLLKRNGVREYAIGATVLSAKLTQNDVRVLSSLTLDDQCFNPSICALFQQLMLALPAALRPSGGVQETWINELLCLLPACSHDHNLYYNASQCAAEYIECGLGPLLLPLHTLMLRSDFWPQRIDRAVRGAAAHNNWQRSNQDQSEQPYIHILLPSQGYSLSELVGDPSGITYPHGPRWTTDFMGAREALFTKGCHVGGRVNESVQDLLFTLDVMAQVVATTNKGLKDRMEAYSRWTTQI